jgi:hypothetical protein
MDGDAGELVSTRNPPAPVCGGGVSTPQAPSRIAVPITRSHRSIFTSASFEELNRSAARRESFLLQVYIRLSGGAHA